MRISFNVNDTIAKRLDEEAKKIGTSRGAMLTTWIGEKIRTLDAVDQMVQQITSPDVMNLLMKYAMEAKFNTESTSQDDQTNLDL